MRNNYGSCQYCGKISAQINQLCEDCYDEEMKNLKEIKQFLIDHPHANAIEISLETNISIHKITRLIKSGTIKAI